MQYISEDNLTAFKLKMSIYHDHEDDHLTDLLEYSYVFLQGKCGTFPVDEPNTGRELMYERARYAYYDSLEYFDANFQSMMQNFALQNMRRAEVDDDADAHKQELPEA